MYRQVALVGGFFCLKRKLKELIMPKVTETGSPVPLEVRITQVRNGFETCGYIDGDKTNYKYVYKELKKALKEVPSMFDVLKAEAPKMTIVHLEMEKEAINEELAEKGDY